MLAAFEQLKLRELEERRACPVPPSDGQPLRLRSEPVNVCHSRAQAHFAVNNLFRPTAAVCNRLEKNEETVVDQATGLAWQRHGSRYPLTFTAAHAHVEQLNALDFAGYSQWRLPTVNELLSLLPDERGREVFRSEERRVGKQVRNPLCPDK